MRTTTFVSIALLVVATGCSTIGTGDRTLIKASTADKTALQYYPHLLVPASGHAGGEVQVLRGIGHSKYRTFEHFLTQRYGPEANVANLGVLIRDKSTLPALLPVEAIQLLQKGIAEAPAASADIQKLIDRENFLRARLLNTPRMAKRTTLHHLDADGREVFYYYPQLEVDFSATLLTPSVSDRFSLLGLIVHLKDSQRSEETGDRTRLVDYLPKTADIEEYTRGQFNQSAQMQSKANLSAALGGLVSGGMTLGNMSNPATPASVTMGGQRSMGLNAGQELSFTWSEAYISELKDALEQRKTGLLGDGQVFFADFRSIREKRIAGTFSFDLLLEVPSEVELSEDSYYSSEPVQKNVLADIYMVGVVRHVYKEGTKGVFIRVPESENDDVYEQVVFQAEHDVPLWSMKEEYWSQKDLVEEAKFKVAVKTNQERALYYAKNLSTGAIVDTGLGLEDTLELKPDGQRYQVYFIGIPALTEDGAVYLQAAPSTVFQVPAGDGGELTLVGEYHP